MMKKQLVSIILALSLLTSIATYVKDADAQTVSFIDISAEITKFDPTLNPNDHPYGIDCGTIEDLYVYVTIHDQGLIARINKSTKAIELFNDPDEALRKAQVTVQNFYSIVRDPNTGNLFVNERDKGKLWRFEPATLTWTRIPIVEQVIHPTISYPNGYNVEPSRVRFDLPGDPHSGTVHVLAAGSFGGVVFANGKVWVGLNYQENWHAAETAAGVPVLNFKGLAKVDPGTLTVTRISIPNAASIRGLAVDSVDPMILWVTDQAGNKVFKFNLLTETVVEQIDLSGTAPIDTGGSVEVTNPRGIATDSKFVYVALNKPSDFGNNSEILKINKTNTSQRTVIDTTVAVAGFGSGTFNVFVNGGLLVWTDESKHVGTIDLETNAKSFQTTTDTNSNRFGCVPIDGQFWFAGQGSAKVGILPNSKFSVGGSKSPTGGGARREDLNDNSAPTIVSYYWTPEAPSAASPVKVSAKVIDDVGVEGCTLFYEDSDVRDHRVVMEQSNGEWCIGDIPGEHVSKPSIKFWFEAVDYNGNPAKSSIVQLKVGEAQPKADLKASSTNLPEHVLQAIKPKLVAPVEKLEVTYVNDKSYTSRIVIRNTGNVTVENIRLMLSPEISKSFKLSNTAITSIEPSGNVTVTLELNGNPNRDMLGNTVGYNGEVMVSAEHTTPIALPVNIGGSHSPKYLEKNYLEMIAKIEKGRYNKVSLVGSILSKHADTQSDYEVRIDNGRDVITGTSDELTIRNISEKELKNIRIYLTGIGRAFLTDHNVIQYLEPNGQVSIKLIPKFDIGKYSPRDIGGEILIVPSNGNPMQIPIEIVGAKQKDSVSEFEVTTGKITKAADKVTIRNIGERTMDSVKITLSNTNSLNRILTLSQDTLRHVEPNEEVTVELRLIANLKTFMQNYNGELTILSEHHNMQSIPISIVWKEITSKHFTLYVREGDELLAMKVADALESSYQNITSRLGEMQTKAVIYMTSSMDEMKIVNPSGHPYYSYADDKIFICGCDDPEYNAVKESVYRIIINNYPIYHNMKKIVEDKENWLVDGVASYLAKMYGKGEYLAQSLDHTTLQWYGYGSDADYAVTHSFFEYLESKYGTGVIDKSLYYLGSGMMSNHRCSTLENCTVLRAVYDVSGLYFDDKRHELNFGAIAKEWQDYVNEHYSKSK